mmetsp:Transcript_1223/g.2514  ORF Transcript_1223/g.2514 Transcript_1223/m.2514 type:complete len:261 (-) Transcript_1223:91-873(-)
MVKPPAPLKIAVAIAAIASPCWTGFAWPAWRHFNGRERLQKICRTQRAATTFATRPTDISVADAERFLDAGYTARSAVYGTVPDDRTADVFELVKEVTKLDDAARFLEGGTFVDLGSGEGGLVMNALTLYPGLDRAIGIELCGERHRVALERVASLPPELRARAEFLDADICDTENADLIEAVRSARVIFIGSVMFEDVLMQRLSAVLAGLVARRGRAAVVISMGKQLDLDDRASAFQSGLLTGSWGLAPVYTYGLLPAE